MLFKGKKAKEGRYIKMDSYTRPENPSLAHILLRDPQDTSISMIIKNIPMRRKPFFYLIKSTQSLSVVMKLLI